MRALTGAGVAALALALAACGSTVPQQSQVSGNQSLGGEQLGEQGSSTGLDGSGPGAVGSATTAGTSGAGGAGASTGSATVGTTGSGTRTTGGTSATGATTGGGQSTAPSGQPVAGPTTVASGPRITTPVKVGFINTKVGNIGAIGLSSGESVSPATVFKALVSAVNAKGGIAGRKVVPVLADTDTASGDWNSDFGAACQRFTRDEPVSVVVGYSFVQLDSFEACLAKGEVPHLSGSYNVGDNQTLKDFPHLVATSAPTSDRRYLLQLQGAVREKFLTPRDKIGLVVDDCPSSRRAVKNTVEPYLKANNLKEVARTTVLCPAGAGDAGPGVAQVQAAVLSFASRGVDRVFIEGIPLILFAATAESQGYHPGYLVTSVTSGTTLEPNMPKPQLVNVHGYGWMPHMDVTRANQPARTAAQTRCLSLLAAGGFVPKEFNDFLQAYASCDGLFLYEAALNRTSGRTGATEIVSAITQLGTSQVSAGLYEGRSTYAGHNAPALYRPWSYVGSCSCFRYTGSPSPMP